MNTAVARRRCPSWNCAGVLRVPLCQVAIFELEHERTSHIFLHEACKFRSSPPSDGVEPKPSEDQVGAKQSQHIEALHIDLPDLRGRFARPRNSCNTLEFCTSTRPIHAEPKRGALRWLPSGHLAAEKEEELRVEKRWSKGTVSLCF